jgi:tetratricopeptide (TPR) repeat protein
MFAVSRFKNRNGVFSFRVDGRLHGVRIRRNFKTQEEAAAEKAVLELKALQLAASLCAVTTCLAENLGYRRHLAALSGERIDRGMEAFNTCLKLSPPPGSPGHDAAHWRLGNLWEKKGDKKAARAAYEAALTINPNFQQAVDSLKKLN